MEAIVETIEGLEGGLMIRLQGGRTSMHPLYMM
jgi:hypothetical protein